MENFTELITRAELLVRAAHGFKEDKKDLQAFVFLDQAVHTYSKALCYATNETEDLYTAIEDCTLRYVKLREKFRLQAFSSPTESVGSHREGDIDNFKEESTEKFKNQLHHWKEGPGFSVIVGLAGLKAIFFNCLIMLPNSRYAARFARTGSGNFDQHILLYGTPGNGKTEIVRAYHQEAKDTRLYIITPADILSKYIGDSENKLDQLFEDAQRNGPSIMFFDEIDGLFSVIKRDGNNVSLLNQFLQLMEKTKGVQVVGATNYPWEMPDATLRRFVHIVHVPLPNKEERLRLLRNYLGPEGLQIKQEHLQNIAALTKGDLKRMANAAIRIPQNRVIKATHFKKRSDDNTWIPCEKNDSDAVRMNFVDLAPDDIGFQQLTIADLRTAAKSNSKTTQSPEKGGETMKKIAEFASKFGCDGRDGNVCPLNLTNPVTCWVIDGQGAKPVEVAIHEDNKEGSVQSNDQNGTESTEGRPRSTLEASLSPEEAPAIRLPSLRNGMAKFWTMFHKKRITWEK